MTQDKINKLLYFIKENKWIIIASIFFIAWKFFLISTLWEDRTLPPEPDDSYIYILHIDSIIKCPSLIFCDNSLYTFNDYGGFEHLTYRLFFGIMAKIMRIDAIDIYHLSFFIGTLLLLPTLIFFLNSLNKNKKIIAISIFFLALYNGAGSYHGFFWPVPSFFSFLIFILILAILIDENIKNWKLYLLLLIPASLQTHTLSIYLLSTIPIFFTLYSFLCRKIDKTLLKKILFAIIITIISYSMVSIYLNHVAEGNPYGIEKITKNLPATPETEKVGTTSIKQAEITKNKQRFPGWRDVQLGYFKWVFPHWSMAIFFVICIIVLFKFKQFKLLSVYFSSLGLLLISSVNINGVRSLIFIWPITYIIYAYAYYYTYVLIIISLKLHKKNILSKITHFVFFIALLIFSTINITYSFFWNTYVNESRNLFIANELITYLIDETQKGGKFTYEEELNFFNTMALLEKRTTISNEKISNSDYLVSLKKDEKKYSDTSLNIFFNKISKILKIKRNPLQENNTIYSQNNNLELVHSKEFNDIIIYKIIK